jgi:hypothetical protein
MGQQDIRRTTDDVLLDLRGRETIDPGLAGKQCHTRNRGSP